MWFSLATRLFLRYSTINTPQQEQGPMPLVFLLPFLLPNVLSHYQWNNVLIVTGYMARCWEDAANRLGTLQSSLLHSPPTKVYARTYREVITLHWLFLTTSVVLPGWRLCSQHCFCSWYDIYTQGMSQHLNPALLSVCGKKGRGENGGETTKVKKYES